MLKASEKLIGFCIFSIIILWVSGALYQHLTSDVVIIKVDSKERVQNQDSSKYLVFTEKEVFENTDALFRLKFDSSDLYGKLKEGGKYTCDVYGWRISLFSMYRNLVSCTEAK